MVLKEIIMNERQNLCKLNTKRNKLTTKMSMDTFSCKHQSKRYFTRSQREHKLHTVCSKKDQRNPPPATKFSLLYFCSIHLLLYCLLPSLISFTSSSSISFHFLFFSFPIISLVTILFFSKFRFCDIRLCQYAISFFFTNFFNEFSFPNFPSV